MTQVLPGDPKSSIANGVMGTPRYPAGVAAMIASSVSFALMAAGAKAARAHVDSLSVVLVRSVLLVALLLLWMRARGIPFRSRKPLLLHVRCLFGVFGLHLYYFALGNAPLGEVVVLANTAPLYVPFLGLAFLAEKPRGALFVLLFVGFVGVVAIAAPGGGHLASGLAGTGIQIDWGLLAAGGTGLATAFALVCLKLLTAEEHPLTLVFTFAVWCLISSLPALTWIEPEALTRAAGPLLLTGLFAIAGQVFITYALSCAPAGLLIVFNYIGVVLSFVIGLVFWGEEPSVATVVGALLIIGVCVVTTRLGGRLIAASG